MATSSESLFAISSQHFQLVTTCHLLTAFFVQAPFQLVPVFARGQFIWLLRQNLHHINHRKPPILASVVKHTADGLTVKAGRQIFQGDPLKQRPCWAVIAVCFKIVSPSAVKVQPI